MESPGTLKSPTPPIPSSESKPVIHPPKDVVYNQDTQTYLKDVGQGVDITLSCEVGPGLLLGGRLFGVLVLFRIPQFLTITLGSSGN